MQEKFPKWLKQPIFHLGSVLKYLLFTSDGALLPFNCLGLSKWLSIKSTNWLKRPLYFSVQASEFLRKQIFKFLSKYIFWKMPRFLFNSEEDNWCLVQHQVQDISLTSTSAWIIGLDGNVYIQTQLTEASVGPRLIKTRLECRFHHHQG